jgi:S-adenosylmethionine decarboxylase
MPGLGRHLLADLYECGCGFDALNAPDRLLALVLEAVRASGATIMSHHVQPFSPHGVTGVVVVAESHLSFHTWPEHAFISLDYFTCGHRVDMDAALAVITAALAPARVDRQVHDRGAALAGALHHPGAR